MTILKRTLDLLGSTFGLVLLLPAFFVISVLIKLDSPGPIVFVQDRIGLCGKRFRIYKFRTMFNNAEKTGTGLFSYDDDPRVTRVGYLLRQLSLDELPQLLNIIRGDMSIVGPRPPVVYELGDYEDFDARLKSRFVVKPGLTGAAQISGRNDLNWEQKIEYDLAYIEAFKKFGILVDISIMFKTVFVVLSAKNTIEKKK